ncbi:bestrophin family protein [Laspinema palackyanum]|uniref:bestrophin family protein n=1 Tax=Laspinema palackyanum TaxID=3231601 RepID=UPI00349F39E7
MKLKNIKGLHLIFQLKGSVIPSILVPVLCSGLFGLIVSVLYRFGYPVSLPVLEGLVPTIVLGLLLVFRTNTAYDRFWEGRKAWGNLVNCLRNFSRQILVAIDENHPEDATEKANHLRLLVAFAVATKLHLRNEPINDELQDLVSPEQYQKLKKMNHPPLEIAFWLGDYLQKQYRLNKLDIYQLTTMLKLLDTMVDTLGASERILKTPMPVAYAIHLKQLLLIYCLALPFQIVSHLDLWTGLIAALISFTLLGIEQIAIEIENPFGYDSNDLPLDTICAAMRVNIEDLISLSATPKISANLPKFPDRYQVKEDS